VVSEISGNELNELFQFRLFHVSEEPDIEVFYPRSPARKDLDPNVGLVWSIDEEHLPNFLTPRDCPRVTYHVSPSTSLEDRAKFFSSSGVCHAVVVENGWYHRILNTVLYLYEFDPRGFSLLDPVAGYYVAERTQYPIARFVADDLLGELFSRNVEVRFTDNLWELADSVKVSTLNWSMCRMKNALPRK